MESEEIKHKPAQPDKTLAGPPDIKPPQYDQAVKHTDNKTLNYLMVRSLYRKSIQRSTN